MPKVSVVIPTYNRSHWIRSAIRSVLDQTFHDFEIIVVDNGSKDGTWDVIKSLDDKRVKYLRIDANNGVSPARNLGITTSLGEYIAFLDDDDEWLPEKLGEQVRLLDESPTVVGGIYTGYVMIDQSTGSVLGQVTPVRRGNLFDHLCVSNCIGTSTVLLRRQCLDRVGLFDPDIVCGEEYDLWLRVAREYTFDFIEEPLVRYSVHTENTSSDYRILIQGLETLLRKHRSILASNRKASGYRYLTIGEAYCHIGDLRKGREAFWKAIWLNPIGFRHYYGLLLSLLGPGNFQRVDAVIHKLFSKIRASGEGRIRL